MFLMVSECVSCAGHGTNVDGLWLRAKAPRGLQVGSVIKFGASSRSYTVRAPFLLMIRHILAYIGSQTADLHALKQSVGIHYTIRQGFCKCSLHKYTSAGPCR